MQGPSTKSLLALLEMEKEKIVPNIIDVAPKTVMEVKYGEIFVDSGTVLSPSQVERQPEVTWEAQADKFYLFCMIDPDHPCKAHPVLAEWRHWIIGNIKGNNISTGDVITNYIGAAPPPGTGLHRYIFLAYQQAEKYSFKENPEEPRKKFKIREFAKKYELGDPVAGNFFQSKWDEGVVKFMGKLLGNKG